MTDDPTTQPFTPTRRTVLAGGAAVVAGGLLATSATPAYAAGVSMTVDGQPARLGTYAFPDGLTSFVLDNGLIRFEFGRSDGPNGTRPRGSVRLIAWSVTVDGVNLAPENPLASASFYTDAYGGRTVLNESEVRVLRLEPDLVEVALVDLTSTPLQLEHHLILRSGVPGLHGYAIMHCVADTAINEVRMNTRWHRGIFDHTYNVERGIGRQPTYAYLNTQTRVQDETWRVDGVNNPTLPYPNTNAGGLPAGEVYSKYEWSLYHHENPVFGHLGNGFGVWFTSLGGVTEDTLCATYGVGPQHQDLAVHQDAIILNYMGANHYGLPAYPIDTGYTRFYGPWLTFVTHAGELQANVDAATAFARTQIDENRTGAAWVSDPLYAPPSRRWPVSGTLALADGRPADGFWIVLSTQESDEVYPIHEPTYFVKTNRDGTFTLPGIPPATRPGTNDPGTYTLYAFASKGSVTDQHVRTGITVAGPTDLGRIVWAPKSRTTHLWQIGQASRTGGEFALASLSPVRPAPREYEKPALIPGTLDFRIGLNWEPTDWYYAQTNPGTWTVSFVLTREYQGTAVLTVSTSMQQAGAPTVAVNGVSSVISGSLPNNNDSTIARQADRSGYPRLAELTFPASALRVGENTITFTHGSATPAGTGPGWDTILLEVDEPTAPGPGAMSVTTRKGGSGQNRTVEVTITNTGSRELRDIRLDAVMYQAGNSGKRQLVALSERDPADHPVPLVEFLAPGQTARVSVGSVGEPRALVVEVSADGGRVRARG